ncbi:MAG: hypothetical protein Q9202_003646 [Teloschistes flavicans]
MAACLPIMKPFYAYFHSLYTGTPTTLGRRGRHHRPSHTQSTFSSNSNSHQGLWHRLRSLRSTRTTLPLPDNHNNNDNIELNLVEEGMDDLPANAERAKRSVLTMPERARDRESGVGTDLPIQGAIEKKVVFGYEEGFWPAGGKEKRREYWG